MLFGWWWSELVPPTLPASFLAVCLVDSERSVCVCVCICILYMFKLAWSPWTCSCFLDYETAHLFSVHFSKCRFAVLAHPSISVSSSSSSSFSISFCCSQTQTHNSFSPIFNISLFYSYNVTQADAYTRKRVWMINDIQKFQFIWFSSTFVFQHISHTQYTRTCAYVGVLATKPARTTEWTHERVYSHTHTSANTTQSI